MITNSYSRRRALTMALLLVTLVIFGAYLAGSAYAQEPSGASPDEGLAPGTQQTLAPGQKVWYKFDVTVDRTLKEEKHTEKQHSKDEDTVENVYEIKSGQIDIWMDVTPNFGTNFAIWTPEKLNELTQLNFRNLSDQDRKDALKDIQPVGRGSTSEDFQPGEYFWSGTFSIPGTYYIEVTNDSQVNSTHTLYVEGLSVVAPTAVEPMPMAETAAPPAAAEEPAEMTEMTEMAEPAAAEEPAEMAEPAAGGTNPSDGLSIAGDDVTLEPAQTVWYKFDVTVNRTLKEEKHTEKQHSKDEDTVENVYEIKSGQIDIWMDVTPNFGTNFAIWTPEKLNELTQLNFRNLSDQDRKDALKNIQPVGRGSTSEDFQPGEYFWSGTFSVPGTYYVAVTNDSQLQSIHALHIQEGQ